MDGRLADEKLFKTPQLNKLGIMYKFLYFSLFWRMVK